MRAIKMLFLFLVVVIAAVFGAHNSDYVKVDLFPFPLILHVKLFIVPLLSCIFGIILGGFYAAAKATYWKTKYNRLVKKNGSAS
jgi:uncharacterized integral membrane protein